ncbi:hypothetical protein VPNG_01013 [Cytospora leucostoma]|uniref:Pseudouridine synthase I TruA alpha/beta domain-containing protein n=1 Tax=Cytospora leucostoma TaxID=1230097 RepID=A0A423XKQ9_9PEZI|nr:hypothetical protein VPNG_01013 [Cytospora leucostoma]
MADYNKWTKDDLIARVKELENEVKSGQDKPGLVPAKHSDPESTSSTSTPLPDEPANKKQKQQKGKGGRMDPNKYATRFIALKLAYLGKNYNGFEYQCSGALSTIEEELWKALVKACLVFPDPERPNEVDWNCCGYSKCGRTDRGVSAFGQVVALRVRSNKPAKGYRPKKTQQQQQQHKQQAVEGAGKNGGSEDVQMGGTPAAEETKPNEEEAKAEEEEEEDYDETPLPVEEEIQYCRILNRILPPDIRVYAWSPNPGPDFSARFSCRERQYRYFFTQPAFQPLPSFLESDEKRRKAGTGARRRPRDGWLDVEAMRKAAKLFEGLHDFRNFCKVDASKQITNFQRRIFEADIVEVEGVDSAVPYLACPQFRDDAVSGKDDASVAYPKVYYFHVRGSAFLWHQIRCMVAVLFLVGQGLEDPSVVAELLDPERWPRRPSYVLAEDTPLVLWDCVFGRENGDGAADEVDWLHVGDESPLALHGGWGVADDLWGYWHERKMDEILANRLLDWVAAKTGVERVPDAAQLEPGALNRGLAGKTKVGSSTRVYEGGHGPRYVGTYVPMSKKDLLQSPEELNDKWAQRKGFKNAEEMRAVGNWRDAIREKKNGGGEGEGAAGDE